METRETRGARGKFLRRPRATHNPAQNGKTGRLGRIAPQLVAEVGLRGPEVAKTVRLERTAAWEKVKKLNSATNKNALKDGVTGATGLIVQPPAALAS